MPAHRFQADQTASNANWAAGSTADDFGAAGIKADVIAESTSATGVTVDGVLLKDKGVTTNTDTGGGFLIGGAMQGLGSGATIALPGGSISFTATGSTFKFFVGTVAAAGSVQGDATAIVEQVTYVTASDGAKGVILPAASAGLVYIIYNTVAANLLVYPATGDDINDGSANAAITMDDKCAVMFVALDNATWAAFGGVITAAA